MFVPGCHPDDRAAVGKCSEAAYLNDEVQDLFGRKGRWDHGTLDLLLLAVGRAAVLYAAWAMLEKAVANASPKRCQNRSKTSNVAKTSLRPL